MFDERLPVHIDPLRMAETRRVLQGHVELADMVRLGESLMDHSGRVEVSLEFGIDEEGIRYMRGHLSTTVSLECQRCLDTMEFVIDNGFALGMVRNMTEAEALPSHYEPLQLDGKPLFLRDVIEDELLLALPIVARHAKQECGVKLDDADAPAETGREDRGKEEKDNPFSVLAGLKTDQKL
ncbi:MAG: YceD family protein [Gammaproteobacteria bacterium]|nr:YceD family protein [Gammaproteobacteria bacterium]MCW8958232.1 YceD family protein [Gammaproteobacteria bacterium]MCW8992481.1 YceD family protein [Gammaproteobacteria bacterium]MCW9088462.1 YceD family protein [Gammaproteobacteria bacterium]